MYLGYRVYGWVYGSQSPPNLKLYQNVEETRQKFRCYGFKAAEQDAVASGHKVSDETSV